MLVYRAVSQRKGQGNGELMETTSETVSEVEGAAISFSVMLSYSPESGTVRSGVWGWGQNSGPRVAPVIPDR